MMKISPSILSCDYGKIAEELKDMENCGADYMHIDVMDGHFVPNITLGAPVVKCIKKATSVPFDVHLMISEPLNILMISAKQVQILLHSTQNVTHQFRKQSTKFLQTELRHLLLLSQKLLSKIFFHTLTSFQWCLL